MKKKSIKNLCLLLILFFLTGCNNSSEIDMLAKRVLGENCKYFEFETIAPTNKGKDVFEIESQNNKIIIRGNNGIAQASGLNYYLENYCNIQVSIDNFEIKFPDNPPMVEDKIRIETEYDYRYIFNYCTYGYTMPWWNWERWEKMIDYMALKGINMPLSIIGQECVWKEVYKELGMSDKQISETFVGPAHLPWHWMGNIDGMGGPLPDSWFEARTELQKKILQRERALGMKPVLQSFTGHVPVALKELYPNAKITQINDWAGVKGTQFLDPTDSLFYKIGSLYLKKQTEMFGTDHFYDADCFIEVDPPSNDSDFLSKVSKTVYNVMAESDPKATWVVQGWFLFFRSQFWQKEQTEAFFSGVPQGKLLVLDLYGEKNPVWDKTNGFYGQNWIWNVICNNDQKINMSGDLRIMQSELERANTSEYGKGLKGIGIIPEGLGYNDPVYDFIFSKTWNGKKVDIEQWIGEWAERRYGQSDPGIREAWKLLSKSAYSRTRTMWSSLMSMPRLANYVGSDEDIRHERAAIDIKGVHDFAMDMNVDTLGMAAETLLSLAEKLEGNSAYEFDLVNVYRELLHSFSHLFISKLTQAYEKKDIEAFDKASATLLKELDDMEAITSCNPYFMVGPWIESAREWGTTDEEKKYYERNARTIVSIWQPYKMATLRDYASRQWSGMINDYYKPRWELYCKRLRNSLLSQKEFNYDSFADSVRNLDYNWSIAVEKYPTVPQQNTIEVAKRIWNDYKHYFNK